MADMFLIFIFWLTLFLLFYTYIGYGAVIYMLVVLRKYFRKESTHTSSTDFYPEVTLIVPAYNEIACIPRKLKNSLQLNYPSGKLKYIFLTEGSTDGTTEYLSQYPNIKVIGGNQRSGKIEAINRAMLQVKSPIVVFTDANTLLNIDAILQLVKHYKDTQVGAVAGEKRILVGDYKQATGAGEGLYWKYESFLKKLDSQLNTTIGAAGELFSLRTDLYKPVEIDTLLDDFIISLRIAGQGYKVVYAPEAYAIEEPSFSIQDEMKRKVRIAAGGFQSIIRLADLLNPFQHGLLSFQYLSHRVLRWAVAPFCLPIAFTCNLFLLENTRIYKALFILQIVFYILAFIGYLFEKNKLNSKLFFIPFYFSFMNFAVYLGLVQFLGAKNQSGKWEKVRRAEAIA